MAAGQAMCATDTDAPGYVRQLEHAYGPPSQQGFGSAVFHAMLGTQDSLSAAALESYRSFVGLKWEQFGESAWMEPWREVYRRPDGARRDVVSELRAIADREVRNSVPMILDVVEGADAARSTLSAAFDDPQVTELRVFNIGDGGAMSGLLVAGRRGRTGEAVMLVFLMD